MDTCPTIKIKPSHPSQGDFVEINEEDFDPKVHRPFAEEAEAAKPARKDKRKAH